MERIKNNVNTYPPGYIPPQDNNWNRWAKDFDDDYLHAIKEDMWKYMRMLQDAENACSWKMGPGWGHGFVSGFLSGYKFSLLKKSAAIEESQPAIIQQAKGESEK